MPRLATAILVNVVAKNETDRGTSPGENFVCYDCNLFFNVSGISVDLINPVLLFLGQSDESFPESGGRDM